MLKSPACLKLTSWSGDLKQIWHFNCKSRQSSLITNDDWQSMRCFIKIRSVDKLTFVSLQSFFHKRGAANKMTSQQSPSSLHLSDGRNNSRLTACFLFAVRNPLINKCSLLLFLCSALAYRAQMCKLWKPCFLLSAPARSVTSVGCNSIPPLR